MQGPNTCYKQGCNSVLHSNKNQDKPSQSLPCLFKQTMRTHFKASATSHLNLKILRNRFHHHNRHHFQQKRHRQQWRLKDLKTGLWNFLVSLLHHSFWFACLSSVSLHLVIRCNSSWHRSTRAQPGILHLPQNANGW